MSETRDAAYFLAEAQHSWHVAKTNASSRSDFALVHLELAGRALQLHHALRDLEQATATPAEAALPLRVRDCHAKAWALIDFEAKIYARMDGGEHMAAADLSAKYGPLQPF